MSEFMSQVPEELFYRGSFPQYGIIFEVANYSDQKLAEKSKMERGYHVKLYPITKETMNNVSLRASLIMGVLNYIEDEIYKSKKELEENRGKTEDEIRLGIKLERYEMTFKEGEISLIFKRVPEDFAREVNQKREETIRYKSVLDQIQTKEMYRDHSKARLN